MSVLVPARGTSRPARPSRVGRLEVALALAAFAVLCVVALRVHPLLVEPDDSAYRASIVAVTLGHFFTLSPVQVQALATRLGASVGRGPGGPIIQWVQLANGRWISEKDPGYPYLAAPFQALGLIRLAPLFFGALASLGLFAGGRRWLGPYGGTVAVALYCSSGAALVFAWRDYMPTFTDASLAAAGTGALLWAMLAGDAPDRVGAGRVRGPGGGVVRPLHRRRDPGLCRAGAGGRADLAVVRAAGRGRALVAGVGGPVRRGGGQLRRADLRGPAPVRVPAGGDP